MRLSGKITCLLLALVLLAGCKQKKKPSLSGDDPVELSDFIDFFRALKLPYQYADTALPRQEKDSFLVSYTNFSRFIPDSVIDKVYGKGVKPKIYALGKAERPKAETYLFVKTSTKDKKALFILAFDSKQQFIASMPVLRPDNNKATAQSMVMDRTFGITKAVSLRNADGSMSDGKDVYVLSAETKSFLLIMTDALNDKVTELINPIDTLPRKNKLSSDYSNGKMNMVSVRDGRRAGQLSFFIHFEKSNGSCTGELKGEATIKSPTMAEYREEGDPCVLRFIFSANAVTLKEEEGCGNRRGLNCPFDGSFARKKYVKPAGNTKTNLKK
ncbi:MAG TPA: hypothetical protein VGO58_04550 [Chitinophagaceae bacterium]|jgi:hypothetical protein|nr:hypothetical protein [Chitinophagaceae bacterium]